MKTVLALTVGGSCAPVVAAVRAYEPTLTCFIATKGPKGSRMTVDGNGKPCRQRVGEQEEENPSIVAQTGLRPEQYRVVEVEDPDDLPNLYGVCVKALRELRDQHPDARHIADYTGGSKSMSVALALAALECGWELSLVRGQRPDLVKVANGTEMAGLINAAEVRARQRLEEARRLFNARAYASAREILEGIPRAAPVSRELEGEIRQWVAICRGLDAWDRFDHPRAFNILQTVQSQIVPQWRFLKRILGQDRASGYEMVGDLIRNAERRASRGRYDDAVARLYRAVELLAQLRLQNEYGLDTSNLRVEALPEGLRPRYRERLELQAASSRDGVIRLGLWEAYALLVELDDPLGKVFQKHEKRLRDALLQRNRSILAHGLSPIGEEDYRRIHEIVTGMIQEGLRALGVPEEAPQFPVWEESP